jgi:pyruvate/2-oxoglutarate dehydrogenase complex dihydrolipoamide dehydrogenase (E3) component
MTDYSHDLIVIGAGMAGINATARAVDAGKRVALIERDRIGGTCPVRGCIPSKALIRSAEIAHEARRAAEFGVHVDGVWVDFAAVMKRVRGIIDRGSQGTTQYLESLDGVELVRGEGRLSGPEEVRVNGRAFSAPRIVIATGAAPGVPPIPGLSDVPYLTSDDVLLNLTHLPEALTVIGGGPIALELSQALSRLGSRVTVIEVLPRLLPDEEPEIVEMLTGYLRDEGIEILTGAEIHEVQAGPRVRLTHDGEERVLQGDALLIATGRTPQTEVLDLESVGVEFTKKGIPVNGHLETSRLSVLAAGDVVGPPYGAWTPVARYMGASAAENALGLKPHDVDTNPGARAIFTDPEIAMVGMTEAEAREAGHDVVVGTSTFSGGKARAWGEERGMAKVVLEKGTRRVLGARVLAYHASDLIHPIAVTMNAGDGSIDPLLHTMHVHPTLGERVFEAAKDAAG